MRVRTIALAFLVIGVAACKTSSTQGSAGTASAERQGTATGQARAGTETGAGATASGTASGTTGEPSASGTATATPGSGASGTASGDVYGTPGSTASSDLKAHSDDQIVSGKISSVSSRSLTIKTDDGADRTLQLVPETSVHVDGQDALGSDLQEGQPVRASFSTDGDRDIAVDVRAGQGSSGSVHDSGSMDSGSTGTTDTGTTGSGMSGTTGSDRKY